MFNLFMDGIIREMKAKVGNSESGMCTRDTKYKLKAILSLDDHVSPAENQKGLQKLTDEFHTI